MTGTRSNSDAKAEPTARILLCCDLDGTVLPISGVEESPGGRLLLHIIAARPEITLAYVTGRDKGLIRQAIRGYRIPVPDYAAGDVGTTIYTVRAESAPDNADTRATSDNGPACRTADPARWIPDLAWEDEIAGDWGGRTAADLAELFTDIATLRLQEPAKQGRFKLSYYAPADTNRDALLSELGRRLDVSEARTSLIWSIDEVADTALLDILPERATKLGAIRFLMQRHGFSAERTIFAGDSGNDLAVLTSGLQAILVRNARHEVREEAARELSTRGWSDRLYVARGGFLGMNGHYAAGVIEGLVHFVPEARRWLEDSGDEAE